MPKIISLALEVLEFVEKGAPRNVNHLLDRFLSKCREITSASAGTAYIVRRRGRERVLMPVAHQSDTMPGQRLAQPEPIPLNAATVAGYVAGSGEAVALEDINNIPDSKPYGFNAALEAPDKNNALGLPVLSRVSPPWWLPTNLFPRSTLGPGGGDRTADGHPKGARRDAAVHQPRPGGRALPGGQGRHYVPGANHGVRHDGAGILAALLSLHRSAALGSSHCRHPLREKANSSGRKPAECDEPALGLPLPHTLSRKMGSICETEVPVEKETGDGHRIACHIPTEELREVEPVIQAAR